MNRHAGAASEFLMLVITSVFINSLKYKLEIMNKKRIDRMSSVIRFAQPDSNSEEQQNYFERISLVAEKGSARISESSVSFDDS